MKTSEFCCVLIILTIFSFQTFCDELPGNKFGMTIAKNKIEYNLDQNYPAGNDFYPIFNTISSNGFTIGGVALLPIEYLSDYYIQSRIRLSMTYDYYDKISLETKNNLIPNGFNSAYFPATYYTINKNVNRIFLDCQYSLKLPDVYLVVNLGSNIYYTIINQDSRKISVYNEVPGRLDTLSSSILPVKDNIIRYENNYRTAVFHEGRDNSIPSFGIGASAGIGTEFTIYKITINPMIYGRINNLKSILFSLDILF